MHSAVYTGTVRHRRFNPVRHAFTYPAFMLSIDLDELDAGLFRRWYFSVDRFNVVAFFRRDYFNPAEPCLKTAVIQCVQSRFAMIGLRRPTVTRVELLTQPRMFNILFNPISVYYCFDDKNALVAIMAEVTNTPWGERFNYVLPVGGAGHEAGMLYAKGGGNSHRFQFAKQFHVSPFNPMAMDYRWVVTAPEAQFLLHIDAIPLTANDGSGAAKSFDATLRLARKNLAAELGGTVIRFPLSSVKVVAGIYWQAFKLWLKRAPFYPHPDSDKDTRRTAPTEVR